MDCFREHSFRVKKDVELNFISRSQRRAVSLRVYGKACFGHELKKRFMKMVQIKDLKRPLLQLEAWIMYTLK